MDLNWEELRCLVAVVEEKNLTSAAKKLGISQPTVSRRIKDLQKSFGSELLQRNQDQYEATEIGLAVYQLARQMRTAAWSIECKAQEAKTQLEGSITLATTDCLAVSWLHRHLSEFTEIFPRVQLKVVTGLDLLSISTRQADIAIRVGTRGPEELSGQKIATINFGLYASTSYLKQHGVPQSLLELNNHTIIDSLGDLEETVQVRFLREQGIETQVAIGTDNLLAQVRAAAEGLGIVPLPHYLANWQPGIQRLLTDEFDIDRDLWLLVHRDLMEIPLHRFVFDFWRIRLANDFILHQNSQSDSALSSPR